jgi:hypothetical protein
MGRALCPTVMAVIFSGMWRGFFGGLLARARVDHVIRPADATSRLEDGCAECRSPRADVLDTTDGAWRAGAVW